VYSPQIHEEISRQRQADLQREAHRERLAALAAINGPGKLARLGGVLASVANRRRRFARRQLAAALFPGFETGKKTVSSSVR
jgi:hypothetical protein